MGHNYETSIIEGYVYAKSATNPLIINFVNITRIN